MRLFTSECKEEEIEDSDSTEGWGFDSIFSDECVFLNSESREDGGLLTDLEFGVPDELDGGLRSTLVPGCTVWSSGITDAVRRIFMVFAVSREFLLAFWALLCGTTS